MQHKGILIKSKEEFAKVLSKIISLRESKKFEEATEIISDVLETNYGLTLSELNKKTTDQLLRLLNSEGESANEKWAHVADLLIEEAEMNSENNNEDLSFHQYVKAFNLLIELARSEKTTFTLGYHARINELFSKIIIYDLPLDTKLKLFYYLESQYKFATADDILFNMIEETNGDPHIREIGIAFFERLLRKSESELLKHNYVRDDAEEGLARIKIKPQQY